MKSIPQIAEKLDLSSTTIREYLKRFNEFFADPVEHEGVKEYPDETEELVQRIHGYYTQTEMTKEEIRVKLGGGQIDSDPPSGAVAGAVGAAMDSEQFKILGDKLDQLILVIENLTQSLTGSGEMTLSNVQKTQGSNEKLNQINNQLTDIIELGKGGDSDTMEKNVLDADGTIIFSFGILSANAVDSLNFAKAHKKPWLHIDLETEKNPGPMLRDWLSKFEVKVLNVAGRRAAKVPGLKKSVNDILSLILKE